MNVRKRKRRGKKRKRKKKKKKKKEEEKDDEGRRRREDRARSYCNVGTSKIPPPVWPIWPSAITKYNESSCMFYHVVIQCVSSVTTPIPTLQYPNKDAPPQRVDAMFPHFDWCPDVLAFNI